MQNKIGIVQLLYFKNGVSQFCELKIKSLKNKFNDNIFQEPQNMYIFYIASVNIFK